MKYLGTVLGANERGREFVDVVAGTIREVEERSLWVPMCVGLTFVLKSLSQPILDMYTGMKVSNIDVLLESEPAHRLVKVVCGTLREHCRLTRFLLAWARP